MEEPKRPRGRPAIAPEHKLVPVTVKVRPETKAKVQQYGSAWVRAALEKAKPPKE